MMEVTSGLAADLRDLLGAAATAVTAGGSLQNGSSSTANISEEYELKLLNFPNRREDLSTAIPLTVIFGLLLVTGCVGNLCTAIVIARPKNKYMHTATNYYLFSLAMSDFLFLILGLPQEMYTLWQRYPYAFGESFCIIRGYLSEATTYASILTISAFTIERYVAICHPLWAHTMSQLPRAITSIVIIWILAAICAIPPAAELGIVTQRGPISNITLEQSAQCAAKRTIYENMFVASAIIFFIVPMIIVTVLYILIAIELRRSSKMNSAISKQVSSSQLGAGQQSARATCHRHLHHHHHHHHHHHQPSNNHHHHRHHQCQHQQHITDVTQSASSPVEGAQKGNLMANLLSQRPSSAIGNEQAPASPQPLAPSGSLTRMQPRASKWPALADFWPGQLWPQQRRAHRLANLQLQCQQHTCARAHINKSMSQALASDPHPAELERHSPLSYHESLLQRPPPASPSFYSGAKPTLSHSTSCQSAGGQQLALTVRQQQLARRLHQHRAHQNGGSQSRRSAAASSKKSVVRMLVAVVVSFFICWVPFHAQRLLASYLVKVDNQNQFLLDIYEKLTYVSGVMYYLSSTINPLLYQLMSAKFRLAFKETFKCSLFRCARFGVGASSKLSASQQHSPTNSLKENQHQAYLAGPQQSCLARLDSKSSQFSQCSALLDCPVCANQHVELVGAHQATRHLNMLNKLRGRLNVSLMSLFRLNSSDCCGCQCSAECKLVSADEASHTLISASNNHLTVAGAHHQQSTPLLADHLDTAGSGQLSPMNKRAGFTFVRCAPSADIRRGLARLSSRPESSEHPGSVGARMADLIRPSEPDVESNQTGPLTGSSATSSGSASAGSSPDQPAESARLATAHRAASGSACSTRHRAQPAAGSSGCSSASNQLEPTCGLLGDSRPSSRRRRSLGSQQSHQASPHPADQTPQTSRRSHLAASGAEPRSRRKSSSSSAYQRHLSSSLSSSDRQLDKKLSMSTTTSALEDCTGSYTTTNSLLTGAGSNPVLANYGPTNSSEAIAEAEESRLEPGGEPIESNQLFTVDDGLTDNLIANEVKLPARLARQARS